MAVKLTQKGDLNTVERYLKKSLGINWRAVLHGIAEEGVEQLMLYTPRDTGVTANSWSYEITEINGIISVTWKNSNINNGVNIALILQYGHATGNGGYVYGVDYINPALKPIFDKLAEAGWREVTKVV
jgi:hypothetical protein